MPECTFTFKRFTLLSLFSVLGALALAPAYAQDMSIPASEIGGPAQANDPANSPAIPTGIKKDDSGGLFDQSSPYTEYGDFNSSEEEDADTFYFQYGRFFGISLGMGYEAATGNRGYLYNPAFPRFDAKIHYWFDFNFAVNMGIFFANHSFDYGGSNYKVNLIGYGLDLKYYFDVRNASAPITFSNPFLIAGVGAISKNQTKGNSATPTADSTMSVSFGAGLEFPISYKKTYLILEGRYNTQSFADNNNTDFIQRIPDLSGGFMTLMAHLLFTW